MSVIDYATVSEFPMREGITGAWIAGREQGANALSVLVNTAQPGAAVPKHFHEYEEVVMVESGEIWVELEADTVHVQAGQSVIIPARTSHAWGVSGPKAARAFFIWSVLEPFAPGKSTYLDGAPPAVT
jgi:quercetin dioxygenase-like cupin family protein